MVCKDVKFHSSLINFTVNWQWSQLYFC